MGAIYIHPYSCKSTTPFARLKLWHLLPNLVKHQIWSTISREEPSYRLPFHIAFTRPPKKMVKKNTHSFQTKKNSNPRLEGRLASDLSWFFGLYYLSNRNFAEISTQHHTWAGRRALTKTPKKTFQPKKAISTGSATRVWAKRNRIPLIQKKPNFTWLTSLKLTASLPLKIDGWKTPFGGPAYVQGLLLVSGRATYWYHLNLISLTLSFKRRVSIWTPTKLRKPTLKICPKNRASENWRLTDFSHSVNASPILFFRTRSIWSKLCISPTTKSWIMRLSWQRVGEVFFCWGNKTTGGLLGIKWILLDIHQPTHGKRPPKSHGKTRPSQWLLSASARLKDAMRWPIWIDISTVQLPRFNTPGRIFLEKGWGNKLAYWSCVEGVYSVSILYMIYL